MGVVPSVTFPTDSRYYGTRTLPYTAPDGQMITYLARGFAPSPGLRISPRSRSTRCGMETGWIFWRPSTWGTL